jgi:hypothetical protein
MPELVDITAVEVIGSYRLRLTFADGTVGDVDFQTREWRGVFEPLRDPEYFARVTVDPELGTIAWPNGADMAPEPLYDEARSHLASTVLLLSAPTELAELDGRGRCPPEWKLGEPSDAPVSAHRLVVRRSTPPSIKKTRRRLAGW